MHRIFDRFWVDVRPRFGSILAPFWDEKIDQISGSIFGPFLTSKVDGWKSRADRSAAEAALVDKSILDLLCIRSFGHRIFVLARLNKHRRCCGGLSTLRGTPPQHSLGIVLFKADLERPGANVRHNGIHVCMRVYMYACVYVRMSVCMYVCLYVTFASVARRPDPTKVLRLPVKSRVRAPARASKNHPKIY